MGGMAEEFECLFGRVIDILFESAFLENEFFQVFVKFHDNMLLCLLFVVMVRHRVGVLSSMPFLRRQNDNNLPFVKK